METKSKNIEKWPAEIDAKISYFRKRSKNQKTSQGEIHMLKTYHFGTDPDARGRPPLVSFSSHENIKDTYPNWCQKYMSGTEHKYVHIWNISYICVPEIRSSIQKHVGNAYVDYVYSKNQCRGIDQRCVYRRRIFEKPMSSIGPRTPFAQSAVADIFINEYMVYCVHHMI